MNEGSAIILLLAALALYLLPSFIASLRGHHNATAIFFLNLLAGWTALGWLAALIWSLTSPAPAAKGPTIIAAPETPFPSSSPRFAEPRLQPPAPAAQRAAHPGQTDADRTPCPFCAEPILPAARKCRFCGSDLPEAWAAPARITGAPPPVQSPIAAILPAPPGFQDRRIALAGTGGYTAEGGSRQAAIAQAAPGQPVQLVHDPNDQRDRERILAFTQSAPGRPGREIGHLPPGHGLLPLLEAGLVEARIDAISGLDGPARGVVLRVRVPDSGAAETS